jgi:hypothetical protein
MRTLHVVHLLIRQNLPGGEVGFLLYPHEHWKDDTGTPYLALPGKKTVSDPLAEFTQGTPLDVFVDAIAARERLLLVVGPKAVTSDYVRQEWQFAWSEADKVVTPILRLGDYPLVPDELKLLHCEDFQNDAQYELHLDNLVRQLGFLGPATVGIHPIYLVPKSQP